MLENNFKSQVEQINGRTGFLGLRSQSAGNGAADHGGHLPSYRSEGRRSKITVCTELRSLQRRWGTVWFLGGSKRPWLVAVRPQSLPPSFHDLLHFSLVWLLGGHLSLHLGPWVI